MKISIYLLLALLFVHTMVGDEFLTNADFHELKDGVPVGWSFQQNETKPVFAVEDDGEGGKCVAIKGEKPNTTGLLIYSRPIELPVGATVTISGEYCAEIASCNWAVPVLVSMMARGIYNSNKICAWAEDRLQAEAKWTKFSFSYRMPYDVASLHLYASLRGSQGTVKYRRLSVQTKMPTHVLAKGMELAWREVEDICKSNSPNDWGKEIAADYFSGRGGVAFVPGKKFDWAFQIPQILDVDALTDVRRTWYVWTRVYGYLEQSRVFMENNGKFVSYMDVKANEKTDANGKYAGPGEYTWQLCGSFTTRGGNQHLTFKSEKRMMFDAVLITDDPDYAPVKYEAKDFPQAKIVDISTRHAIRAEYVNEGVTDTITLPITFRIAGQNMPLDTGKPPAVFHFSLPENIKVEALTSHFAGENWSVKSRWHGKYLTWKKTGSHQKHGRNYNDYEAYLYWLSSNQYLIYVKADSKGFKQGDVSLCEYWLEHEGEKQLPEVIELKHIAIKPTSPFKNIHIGPAYVVFDMLYTSMPNCFDNMAACGFNYLGAFNNFHAWGEDGKENFALFEKMRDEAYSRNFKVIMNCDIYKKIGEADLAWGLNEKPLTAKNADKQKIVSLAMDENSLPMQIAMKEIRELASLGISVELDDEMMNRMGDRIDYSPKTQELFRKWLAENRRSVPYKSPVEIVKNKANDPDMYNHWVDFKCSRMAYWYSLYRKAFEEGLAQAKGKYPEGQKPMMIACVDGAGTQCDTYRRIMEISYFDYKMLEKHLDYISVMAYSYGGVAEADKSGKAIEMYRDYMYDSAAFPILLAGGYGCEIGADNKAMLKYEVLEALMLKCRVISFYAGATLFNAPTLAPVVEAIRIARPYEDFFLNGRRCRPYTSDSKWLRTLGLKLENKLLLYAANYRNNPSAKATIVFDEKIRNVIDCSNNEKLQIKDNSIAIDFKNERGRLFLVEY